MWRKILKYKGYLAKRFSIKQPANYFCLIVQDISIKITRFQEHQVVDYTELSINDEQFQELDLLLNSFPSYPIYIVLKGQEPHFRVISLTAARWWHRRSLLKQAKDGEFSKTSWVHARLTPSPQDDHRYLLAGAFVTPFLQALINNLKHLSNPVIGIQFWPLVFAEQVFKTLKTRTDLTLDEWVMILRQQKTRKWQLIVCHHQAVILNRSGKFKPQETVLDLTHEVMSTMRYLNRCNYQQGDPITLVQIGIGGITQIEKLPQLKVVNLKNDNIEDLPLFSPFQVPELRPHYLAYTVPQKLVKIGTVVGLTLLISSGGLLLDNYFLQQTCNLLLKQQLSLKLPAGSGEQLRLSQLFQAYQSIQSPDPLPALRQLSKSLPPHAVAIDLSWIAQKPKTSSSELVLNLVVDKQALSGGDLAVPLEQNWRLHQEKIQQEFLKFAPGSELSWGSVSNDFKCSLKITYTSKNLSS